MQVKKFIGESLPQALQLAKRHMGGDVVLLESREVDGGIRHSGQTMIEITVGLEQEEVDTRVKPWNPPKIDAKIDDNTPPFREKNDNFTSLVNEILTKKTSAPEPGPPAKHLADNQNKKNTFAPVPENGRQQTHKQTTEPAPQQNKILQELTLLRQEIGQLRKGSKPAEKPQYPSLFSAAYEELLQKGVEADMAEKFMKQVYRLLGKEKNLKQSDVRDALMMEMNQMLTTFSFEQNEASPSQKTILLLGATGVGKSTTAMKLAAHPDIYGKKDVVIISVDPYGPSEALKSFSRMNGTTVHEEKNVTDLQQTIQRFKSKDVIIIDTPGKSPFAPNHLDTLESYVKHANPTDIFLVLGMNGDLQDLYLTCAMYLMLKPTGVVFTKFDETTRPGKIFSILDTLNLPVACFCEGKRIFIDIEVGSIEYIYNKFFEEDQGRDYDE